MCSKTCGVLCPEGIALEGGAQIQSLLCFWQHLHRNAQGVNPQHHHAQRPNKIFVPASNQPAHAALCVPGRKSGSRRAWVNLCPQPTGTNSETQPLKEHPLGNQFCCLGLGIHVGSYVETCGSEEARSSFRLILDIKPGQVPIS